MQIKNNKKGHRILVLGSDGYIGTALCFYLNEKGFNVKGIDSGLRERNVKSVGSESLTPKQSFPHQTKFNTNSYLLLKHEIRDFKPDTIVNLAHQPSAPFSMKSPKHATHTQKNNVMSNLNVLWAMREVAPDAHLIELGSEGEFPAGIWDGKHIPEGARMKVYTRHPDKDVGEYKGDPVTKMLGWEIPTPRWASSFYHFAKIFSSYNTEYACDIWGLKATNVNQGVVYSHRYGTRFDYDDYFGTIVNRFVAQAVSGEPMTVYGKTGGQTRGFINLQNSLEAIELLALNPPKKGEFRAIHQTTREYSVLQIAKLIQANLPESKIEFIDNPRVEPDDNKFTFDTSTLDNLGLKEITMEEELPRLIEIVKKYKDNIRKEVLKPRTTWKK